MPVKIVSGDLLDAFDKGDVNVIGHVVSCQSVMSSGLALSIKQRYPLVFKEYQEYLKDAQNYVGGALGRINYTCLGDHQDGWRTKKVYNLFAQDRYGRDKRHLKYGALGQCLTAMSYGLTGLRNETIIDDDVIGFPYLMGSDRGGGDWNIVLEMIEFFFRSNDVIIYKL